jgi:hypothetical protein
VKVPQGPVNTPILVSKLLPQRLNVTEPLTLSSLYHTPGAVFNPVVQVGTASEVAPVVVPVTVTPQVSAMAPEQRSFTIGSGALQLEHATVPV